MSYKNTWALAGLGALAAVCLSGSVSAQSQYGDQYWHERYHGILSMAAYGDYDTLCPQTTFTNRALHKSFPNSNADPWNVIETFGPTASGLEGFTVVVPEMDKIVIVFKGIYDWLEQFGTESTHIGETFGLSCSNCKAHAGAVQAYQEAKAATNNWAKAAAAVERTGHQWSITGHGFGGMVAQVASIDLGWSGRVHWSHNHGSPRVFNLASAQLYEKLFNGEAGQRVVANNDALPDAIPASSDYVHAMQGIHVYGDNPNYGMYMKVCTYREDPDCEGGNVESDTWYYYTQVGTCGGRDYSASAQRRYEASMSSEFAGASATGVNNSTANSTIVTVTSTSTSLPVNMTTTILTSSVVTSSTINSTSIVPSTPVSSSNVETPAVTATTDAGNAAVNAQAVSANNLAPTSALQGSATVTSALSNVGILAAVAMCLGAAL